MPIALEPAADARHDGVRQRTGPLEHLRARLVADDPLEVAHHRREGVRPGHGAEHVVRVVDVGDPVAHRLVDGVLERLAAGVDGDDLGAQQPHPGDVERLPPGVLLAHVDRALEAEQGGRRGGRDAVLAGAGLGDHPALAHAAGQQRLAEHVVDLVRAGVVEVLALEQDPGATGSARRSAAPRSAGWAGRCSARAGRAARPGRRRRGGPSRRPRPARRARQRGPRGRSGRRRGRSGRGRRGRDPGVVPLPIVRRAGHAGRLPVTGCGAAAPGGRRPRPGPAPRPAGPGR